MFCIQGHFDKESDLRALWVLYENLSERHCNRKCTMQRAYCSKREKWVGKYCLHAVQTLLFNRRPLLREPMCVLSKVQLRIKAYYNKKGSIAKLIKRE